LSAFTAYTDPLTVQIDQPIHGQNLQDNRSVWHGLGDIVFDSGGLTGTQWYSDNGPNGLDPANLEPRSFCTRGGCHWTFSGRTLIVRLNVAWAWYQYTSVLVDGVVPSSIPGILQHSDTLSCHAGDYPLGTEAAGYVDVVVADGLTDQQHDVSLLTFNSDAAKFFSIAGFKVATFASQTLVRANGWILSLDERVLTQNLFTLTLSNRSANTVAARLDFPDTVRDADGAVQAPILIYAMAPGASSAVTLTPAFDGSELSGVATIDLTLSGQYLDPDGTPTIVPVIATIDSPALAFTPLWNKDAAAPGGVRRAFTSSFAEDCTFTFQGETLWVSASRSIGWGVIGIFAANNTTLLGSVNCDADFGGGVTVVELTGFSAGSNAVHLRKTLNDGKFIVFTQVEWEEEHPYTEIEETVQVAFAAQQPLPMQVTGVVVGDYDATWDEPDLLGFNYDQPIVRSNAGLQYTEVMQRFPTFAVCYQGGFFDTLGEYDILIIDPFASHAVDVFEWQQRGLQVYGYVASGEEVGFYSNRYDFASALAANKGDGLGPGGWASYYMFTRYGDTSPSGAWVGAWSEPDKNGVWASYYINPDPAHGWPARLESFYMPLVLGEAVDYTDEEVVTKSASTSAGPRVVFDSAHAPFDLDQPITLKSMDGLTSYLIYRDFTFDPKTGAVVLAATLPVTAGTHLKFTYTRKGLNCDGVFWDVVDTPDVYSSTEFGYEYVAGYADLFINMINTVKANHPDKLFISNRGFTILDSIIHSCSGVMFESYLTGATDLANLATTDYYRITDPAAIAYNEGIHTQLRRLREDHTFDVFSLNYCNPDDLELQAYMRAEDEKRGYLSWQSTILLNTPAHNTTLDTPGPRHVSTAFTRYKTQAPRDDD